MGPRIGIGSFGEVYRGSWRHTDVAVKRLLEQEVQPAMIKARRMTFCGVCTRKVHCKACMLAREFAAPRRQPSSCRQVCSSVMARVKPP